LSDGSSKNPNTLSLSIECLVFQRLVFRSRSPRFGFVRPVFFVCFPTTAHHEYIERKLDRLGDGLRRDRPWR
jgi:hypothetical protein